ncbi:hypothetical protein [Bowmanella dokdonensis]|uniref:Uncharacterized protein n=1 Tax=Bowmanella dokdonensis TaxID=751969 RepID=A0A939DQG5_9ALTE|nr:hypothetical protein [Bowmanella dokdonensis]MBN7827073.1 hypothetical protein [Bowmanella dokdonensis]
MRAYDGGSNRSIRKTTYFQQRTGLNISGFTLLSLSEEAISELYSSETKCESPQVSYTLGSLDNKEFDYGDRLSG